MEGKLSKRKWRGMRGGSIWCSGRKVGYEGRGQRGAFWLVCGQGLVEQEVVWCVQRQTDEDEVGSATDHRSESGQVALSEILTPDQTPSHTLST